RSVPGLLDADFGSLWLVRPKDGAETLFGHGRSLRPGLDGEAAGDYVSARSLAVGLLATRPCGFYARVLEQGSPARVLIARYRETPPVCPLRCQRNHYHEGAERRRSGPLRNRISVCRALRKRSACLRALFGQGG